MPMLPQILLTTTVLALGAAWGQCRPVRGERIMAEDLAAAVPAFAAAPGRVVAPAPLAGSERRFERAEMERVARRLGLAVTAAQSAQWPESVCFAYALAPLTEDRLRQALAKTEPALAEGEIVDFSRFPVPEGPIEFLAATGTPDRRDGSRLLRGGVAYAVGRKQPVWVRVRAHQRAVSLKARQDLAAGEPIDATAVELTPAPGKAGITRLEELDGLVPRRSIAAGTTLTRGMFGRARDVDAGQTISVSVRSGRARLSFQARAETSGSAGDQVLVRSPVSNQRLRVRVSGRGRAAMDVAPITEKE